MPGDGSEAKCKVMDLSPGGAQLASEYVPPVDTAIVVYIDGFGRLEGVVLRPDETTFGVKFNCSALKRERVAEQLTLYINRGEVDKSVLRRHDRTATKGFASFSAGERRRPRLRGGRSFAERRFALKTDARPPLGEVVLIGQMAGKVVRHAQIGRRDRIELLAPPGEKASPDRQPLTLVR